MIDIENSLCYNESRLADAGRIYAGLAQPVERLIRNHEVESSNLSSSSRKRDLLRQVPFSVLDDPFAQFAGREPHPLPDPPHAGGGAAWEL